MALACRFVGREPGSQPVRARQGGRNIDMDDSSSAAASEAGSTIPAAAIPAIAVRTPTQGSARRSVPASSRPPARTADARSTPRKRGWARRNALPLFLFAGIAALALYGLPYYLQPLAMKVRNPSHAWLKPTGLIGQTVGILAFALFLFLWLYPLRKKFRWLAFTGAIARWLDVHIVVGLLVPALAAVHAGFRFEGLIGLGYLSMLLVSFSGLIGKYLYVRIPHSRSGLELTMDEIAVRRKTLAKEIGATISLPPDEVEKALAEATIDADTSRRHWILLSLLSNDIARFRAIRALRRRWTGMVPRGSGIRKSTVNEVIRLARRQIALTQQVRMLDATHRIFHYWHVAHRPVAITALLAVVIHVGATVGLGVTWFW